MSGHHHEEEEHDDHGGGGGHSAPAWMVSFADMITLLMTFFVLLLSFANTDGENFHAAIGSVQDALGVDSPSPGSFAGLTTTLFKWEEEAKSGAGEPNDIERVKALVTKIKALVMQKRLNDDVAITVTEHAIVMRVRDLFDAASAELEPRVFETLDLAVDLCRAYDQPISIEAHTDDHPIRNEKYASNWELSALRASVVARYLAKAGGIDPTRLSPIGYASYRPIVPNDSDEHRAENRRVDIVLMREGATPAQVTNTRAWGQGR